MSASRKKKKSFAASHQRSWIWGRHAVMESLAAGRWPLRELYLAEDLPEDIRQSAEKYAAELDVQPCIVPSARIQELCHAHDHQGCLARMAEFPYADPDSFLNALPPESVVLVLDRIQDSHNFGALIRSAEVFGAAGVVVGKKAQASVNGQVVRSSAGAVSRLPIVEASDLQAILRRLAECGVPAWAAMPGASTSLMEIDLKAGAALVVGNEAEGVHHELVEVCTGACAIPQAGAIGSLNAAAAGAVCLYEALRQKQVAGGHAGY